LSCPSIGLSADPEHDRALNPPTPKPEGPPERRWTPFRPLDDIRGKLEIESVIPTFCRQSAECDVAVAFTPAKARVVYCRFGDVTVRGSLRSDQRLHCRAPLHGPGDVNLTISRDGKEFSEGVAFTFQREGWFSFWLIAVPGSIVGGLFAVAWAKRNKVPKRRRRKAASKTGLTTNTKAKSQGVSRRQISYV
jgi:hypothetical protein